jgi:phosphatidylglycerophosphatase A
MNFKRRAVLWLATGGGVGRLPWSPGTFGSLIGIPLGGILGRLGSLWSGIATALIVLAAVWIAHMAELQLGTKDPGCVIIDEIAGMAVALWSLPFTLATGIAGFLLFRAFDIIKPPPVRQAERWLSGGWGIVMDDVLAGVMAQIVLRLGRALVQG